MILSDLRLRTAIAACLLLHPASMPIAEPRNEQTLTAEQKQWLSKAKRTEQEAWIYVTDAGLVGSETTIGGFSGSDENGIPEFVRMRRAVEDASSIAGKPARRVWVPGR